MQLNLTTFIFSTAFCLSPIICIYCRLKCLGQSICFYKFVRDMSFRLLKLKYPKYLLLMSVIKLFIRITCTTWISQSSHIESFKILNFTVKKAEIRRIHYNHFWRSQFLKRLYYFRNTPRLPPSRIIYVHSVRKDIAENFKEIIKIIASLNCHLIVGVKQRCLSVNIFKRVTASGLFSVKLLSRCWFYDRFNLKSFFMRFSFIVCAFTICLIKYTTLILSVFTSCIKMWQLQKSVIFAS